MLVYLLLGIALIFGLEPASSTPAQLAQRTRADYERWGQVVKATGFKIA